MSANNCDRLYKEAFEGLEDEQTHIEIPGKIKNFVNKFDSAEEFANKVDKGGYGNLTIPEVVAHIDNNTNGALDFNEIRASLKEGGDSYFKSKIRLDRLRVKDSNKVFNENETRDISKDSNSPIVVGAKGNVIDGRHRVMSAAARNDTLIEAYIPSKDYFKLVKSLNSLKREPVSYGDEKYKLDGTLGDSFDKLKEIKGIDVRAELLDYTANGFKEINRAYLRGEDNYALNHLFNTEGNYNKSTYRGTRIPNDKLNELKEGDLINNKIILSSSKDFEIADIFSDNPAGNTRGKQVIIEFDNTDSSAYDIAEFSTRPKEKEVLIAPDSVLKIESLHIDESDIYRLKVKVLNANEQTASRENSKQNITNIMSLTGGSILLGKGIGNSEN